MKALTDFIAALYDRTWAYAQEHPVLGTLAITPFRVYQAFADPIRRRHIAGQWAVGTASSGLALLSMLYFPKYVGLLTVPFLATALNYLLYEFVAEPIFPKWFGPYWERGPRDGERFTYE